MSRRRRDKGRPVWRDTFPLGPAAELLVVVQRNGVVDYYVHGDVPKASGLDRWAAAYWLRHYVWETPESLYAALFG